VRGERVERGEREIEKRKWDTERETGSEWRGVREREEKAEDRERREVRGERVERGEKKER
jgi:hypothetical protein